MDGRREHSEVFTAADVLPSPELCEQFARRVEVHLRNGNVAIAVRVLEEEFRKAFRDELAEERAASLRSGAEWLTRPLAEFRLQVRTLNALEEAGCETMQQALELLNTGHLPPMFGPSQADEVWQAAIDRKITTPRKYTYGGKRDKRSPDEVQAARERWSHPTEVRRGGANGM